MNRIAKRHEQTRKMVLVALLAALVVVFQTLSTFLPPIGPVVITLTLIPVGVSSTVERGCATDAVAVGAVAGLRRQAAPYSAIFS